MIHIKNKKDCCGCGACFQTCPVNCISMNEDKEGFLYPHVNEKKCISCGKCLSVCPIMNIKKNNGRTKAYAIYAKNKDIVKNSSSGGVFSVLAELFVEENGCVFGASFDKTWHHVRSTIAETKKDIYPLRRAKYLQCDTGQIYNQIKEKLKDGRKVLYCGTPCQIEGLNNFLGKDDENLFLIDFICHGVSSPLIWKEYLNKFSKKVVNVNFRDKRYGWEKNTICISFDDGNEFVERNTDNPYIQSFLNGLSMRPSCFSCRFKGIHRNNDLTIGDLWGAKFQCSQGYNEQGTSLVLIHTDKGFKLLEKIKDKVHCVPAPMPESIAFNGSIKESTPEPKNREYFFSNFDSSDFKMLVTECIPKKKDKRHHLHSELAKKIYHRLRCLFNDFTCKKI